MNLESLIQQGKPEYIQSDIREVTSSIFRRLDQTEGRRESFLSVRHLSWAKKAVAVAGVIGCTAMGTGAVAYADGVNVIKVVVQFVHNITYGSAYGSGYGLENTSVNLTLDNPSKVSPSSSSGTASRSSQRASELSSTQLMSDGSLYATNYGAQLNSYLGTDGFPKLVIEGVSVAGINAYAINRDKGIFYMYVHATVPGKPDQMLNFDVYHKTGGTVVIDGQTMANIKNTVAVSGINGTYVEFTNKTSFLNYLTWKSGDWIFVLHSNNVPEQALAEYAQDIEKQVAVN